MTLSDCDATTHQRMLTNTVHINSIVDNTKESKPTIFDLKKNSCGNLVHPASDIFSTLFAIEVNVSKVPFNWGQNILCILKYLKFKC